MSSKKVFVADFFDKLSKKLVSVGGSSKDIEHLALNVANRVYVQEEFKIKSQFADIAATKFHSGAEPINFSEKVESAKKINRWVETNTHDKIKDLIQPDGLTVDTRLVLVNVVYFKDLWAHNFHKSSTKQGIFYINDKDTVIAQYMRNTRGFEYAILDDLDATAVKLPYLYSDMSFVVILPNKRNGLSELERKWKDYEMKKVTDRMYEAEVDVALPKFKFEYEINLNDVLKKVTKQKTSLFKYKVETISCDPFHVDGHCRNVFIQC